MKNSPKAQELIWGITETTGLTHYSISRIMAVSECTVSGWAIGIHASNKLARQFLGFLLDAGRIGGKGLGHALANEQNPAECWLMIMLLSTGAAK